MLATSQPESPSASQLIDHSLRLDKLALDEGFWPALADQSLRWLDSEQIPRRDAVVLLPFAQLLPLARRAFAAQRGWQPRIETTLTLAASLGPAPAGSELALRSDLSTNRLNAAKLLRQQAWAQRWARRDPQGFDFAAAALAVTAQAFASAELAQAPDRRPGFWARARALLVPVAGPGGSERLLARMALEWAVANDPPTTDRLFELRPSAWIVVDAGGEDPLGAALAAAGQAPALRIATDAPAGQLFDAPLAATLPRRLRCAGFEDEAQGAAAEVIDALNAGHTPVALVAQDRLLVRRVRALLERAQVAMRDETGWTLSTTRAAARVMTWLRAAAATAGPDALLDALKCRHGDTEGLRELEALWRGGTATGAKAVTQVRAHATTHSRAQTALDAMRLALAPLAQARRQSLAAWLEALRQALWLIEALGPTRDGEPALGDDPAHRRLLAALRLGDVAPDDAWRAAARDTTVDLAGFTAWVDGVLEAESYVPEADDSAQVVITPLERTLLRPFGAVVLPGTDHRRLGAPLAAHPLLADGLLRELGLPNEQARRERETLAFAQLLRQPRLTLLRREHDGSETLGPSVLVERAMQVLQRRGVVVAEQVAVSASKRRIEPAPLTRPAPGIASDLPKSLSASAVQALRDCPYRFFATSVLRLHEADELEAGLEKRDYGTWLHAVLHRFHTERHEPASLASEAATLLRCAGQLQAEMQLPADELLPYRAAFAAFVPRYLAWLHQRDAKSWRFEAGELAASAEYPRGVSLHGRIDRVDARAGMRQLIDYKTERVASLKEKLRQPLEDTQLAVYAALVMKADGPPAQGGLSAMYLALDSREDHLQFEHADVAASARALVDGLGDDLAQLREGAGAAALGEGTVCEFCAVRGLCRRDHWSAT